MLSDELNNLLLLVLKNFSEERLRWINDEVIAPHLRDWLPTPEQWGDWWDDQSGWTKPRYIWQHAWTSALETKLKKIQDAEIYRSDNREKQPRGGAISKPHGHRQLPEAKISEILLELGSFPIFSRVAREVGVSDETVARIAREAGIKSAYIRFSEEKHEQIREALKLDQNFSRVAREVGGISRRGVARIALKLGIKPTYGQAVTKAAQRAQQRKLNNSKPAPS